MLSKIISISYDILIMKVLMYNENIENYQYVCLKGLFKIFWNNLNIVICVCVC